MAPDDDLEEPSGTVEPIAALRDAFLYRIDAHDVSIGMQGYVGLPLALTFVDKGFRVLGFDVDAERVATLNRGECYIRHVDATRVKRARETLRFEATADFTRLHEPDAILIHVPTPLTAQKEPDLTYVRQTADAIRLRLRRGQGPPSSGRPLGHLRPCPMRPDPVRHGHGAYEVGSPEQ